MALNIADATQVGNSGKSESSRHMTDIELSFTKIKFMFVPQFNAKSLKRV